MSRTLRNDKLHRNFGPKAAKRMRQLVLEPLEGRSLLAAELGFAFRIGGTGQDANYTAITTDGTGNIYAAGVFVGSVDFDPGPATFNLTATGSPSAYVAKYAPSGELVWARATGGGRLQARSVAVDSAGNVLVCGGFTGTVDFDPGPGTANLMDVDGGGYLLKLDAAGSFVWARQISGPGDQGLMDVAVSPAGDIYVGGGFNTGSADLDPGPGEFVVSTAGNRGAFIVKLDASGSFQWGSAFTGPAPSYADTFAITLDVFGNVLATGALGNTIDFDPGATSQPLTSAGIDDAFITKLDANGNLIWAQRVGGSSNDNGQAIDTDALGNVYVGGMFSSVADFDPGPGTFALTSAGSIDGFIAKFDVAGALVWAGQLSGIGPEAVNALDVDSSGSIYATGSFGSGGVTDFDPGPGVFNLASAGAADVFVLKLTNSGAFDWASRLGGTGSDGPTGSRGIALDAANNILLTGFFSGVADFDPGPGTFNLTSASSTDAYVVKLKRENQPPSSATAGGPYVVPEGGSVTLTGSAIDADGDPLSYVWDLDNNGSFETIGQNVVFSGAGRDGPDSQTVVLRVADTSGASATATVIVSITNAAPTATDNAYATAQATAVSGNVITDDTGSGADSDPAGASDPLTISAFTSPRNGALVLNANGSFTYMPDSTFSGSDSFTYTIGDGDGGFATATVTIYVAQAAAGSILTIPDTCLGGTAVLITGTSANDTIVVEPGATATTLNVTFNGVTSTASKPSGRIIVTGGAGDDNIQVAGAITNQAWEYGGPGHDRLKGGAGNDMLMGGEGDDLLVGGSGRDLLIGGTGADRIVGNSDDDILIAGTTAHDELAAALCAIIDEWTRTDQTYEQRITNLTNGGGANGDVKLLNSGANRTVFDDSSNDVLTGSSGWDWFFFDPEKDRATDLNDEVFANDLSFILA